MSTILTQLAAAFGAMMFLLIMGINLANDVPVLDATFRAFIVMFASSVIVAFFFKFFVKVLYRFVAEQVLLQRQSRQSKPAEPQKIRKELGAETQEQ